MLSYNQILITKTISLNQHMYVPCYFSQRDRFNHKNKMPYGKNPHKRTTTIFRGQAGKGSLTTIL